MKTIVDREDFVNNHSHESFFIEAGAGAGKSTTMVDKIVHNILSGISPERIVAITFTNKSAEDLLIRVTNRVDSARNLATGKDKERLNNAFYSIYKMNISTIHSFCYKILSEYSFAAEIPFGTKLIMEEDIAQIADSLYNNWYRDLSIIDLNKITAINNITDNSKIIKSTKTKIRDTYDYLVNRKFYDMEIVNVTQIDLDECYDYSKEFNDFLCESIKEGYSLSKTANEIVNLFELFFNKYPSYVKNDSAEFYQYYRDLTEILQKCKCSKVINKSANDLDYEERNKEYQILKERLDDTLTNLAIYFIKDCNDYALRAYDYYLSHRENDVITNNELIYKTYELMKNAPEARKRIASQYDVIYVDEFQDTDIYQIELVKLLAKEMDERKTTGEVGSLVVVGDPKQSIYRFRGADFQSYMDFKEIFESLATPKKTTYSVVSLPDNFRSSSIILNWVNDTYSAMTFYPGYTYSPMLYPSNHLLLENYKENPKRLAGVYLHNLHINDDYSKTAELVDFLVKNKYQIMVVADPKDKHSPYMWKEIEYRDFMVIFASKTHLNECSKAFAKRGIPYDITGRLEVSSNIVIRELVRIINYLLIPDEDNKKTTLDILSHHFKDKAEAETALRDLEEKTKDLSDYGKVYYVFNHYDQYSYSMIAIDTKGVQAAIYQILENHFQKDNMSAVEIMDDIFTLITEYQDTAIAIDRDSDAVKIMNAHQTKGLEANIVFYVTAQEKNDVDSSEIVDKKIYLNSLSQHKDILELCKKQILEECLRKEYVVSTRARQVMIFDDELLAAKTTRLYNIPEYPYDWTNLNKYHVNEIPDDTTTPIEEDEQKLFEKNKKGVIVNTSTPLYVETTPSKLEQRKNPEPSEDLLPKNNVHRPKNNDFGTMLHRCNELYVREPNKDIDDIVDFAMKEYGLVDQYYRKYLRKCLFATKDLFTKNNLLEGTLEPEYKFYYYIKNTCKTPILMNGSIDLMIVKDKIITIIDYKSDSADYQNKEQFEKVLKENYQPQLEAYKKFVSTIYPDYQINTNIVWYEEIDDMTTARLLKI